jgi:serine/threonine-protein kinase
VDQQSQAIANLQERFHEVSLLLINGFHQFYIGWDSRTERQVVIKILKDIHSVDIRNKNRFLGEIRRTSQLFHPQIVPLYEAGELSGTLYATYPFLDVQQCALGGRMYQGNRLAAADILPVFLRVARALEYCHHRDVLHCDIKPANVLLADNNALLWDFAISRDAHTGNDEFLSEGSCAGTPHYMSPEQCTAQRLDARSDLYSLGVVAYECIAGRPPFEGQVDEIMRGHYHEIPPALDAPSEKDNQFYRQIVCRLLEKDPRNRFQSASELIDALLAMGASGLEMGNLSIEVSPYEGEEPFFVACYAREDFGRFSQFLQRVAAAGYNVWYDKGIPAGDEWDATIERRIRNSAALICFLSERSVRSKHVRREIKFADSLDKRVIPVRLESLELADGLAMLIQQYQIVDLVSLKRGNLQHAFGPVHRLSEQVVIRRASQPDARLRP